MKRTSIVGIFSIATMASVLMPLTVMGQQKSLKDQLVGTWIYVSSTAKRDDGSNVPRPSLQGAVTYTADGRFHFITTRTDAPKYASGDLARPSPEEAMAIASGSIAYTGTYTVEGDKWTTTVDLSHNEILKRQPQVRYFKVDGDKLDVRTPEQENSTVGGKRAISTLEWVREH